MLRAVVFDLDGVLVDTAQFHLAAWRRIARELGFELADDVGEDLKGVAREAALAVVTRAGGVELSPEVAAETAARKNRYYNEHLRTLNAGSLLPGARSALEWLAERGIPIALGSASRNARTILASTGIEGAFDAIVDGVAVRAAKPDPEVFLEAARRLGVPPESCLVLEDAVAGVEAARRAGCAVIGVGDPTVLSDADDVVPDLAALDWASIFPGGGAA